MKFDVRKTIEYWKTSAKYDIETAEAIFEKQRYPYALFMGHLALEKMLKALFVRDRRTHAPRTHSLPILACRLKTHIPDDMIKRFAEYMRFCFEARYPGYNMEFYQMCTNQYTQVKLDNIKEDFKWLMKQL